MDHRSAGLRRRQFCAAAVLGSGLGVADRAEAHKMPFKVIFHFPWGGTPENRPLPSADKHGQMNRLNVITSTHGWRLNFNTGFANEHDAAVVHSRTYSHLISLSGEAGPFPKAYGTETLGGLHGSGSVIWWHTTNRHYIHDLYTFDPDGSAGLHPQGGLIEDFDGAMLGTTSEGGSHGAGTIFRTTTSGELTVLHHFHPAEGEGRRPVQCPACGPDGHYYGLTPDGGKHDRGTLWRLSPDGAFETLHSFDGPRSGAHPLAALTLSPDGLLYGVTSEGGEGYDGTLFSFSPVDARLRVLRPFRARDAFVASGTLCALPDGTLYGTSQWGGQWGSGNVFRYTPSTHEFEVVYTFEVFAKVGFRPIAGLALAPNGCLYGVTGQGGLYDGGTLFRIAP